MEIARRSESLRNSSLDARFIDDWQETRRAIAEVLNGATYPLLAETDAAANAYSEWLDVCIQAEHFRPTSHSYEEAARNVELAEQAMLTCITQIVTTHAGSAETVAVKNLVDEFAARCRLDPEVQFAPAVNPLPLPRHDEEIASRRNQIDRIDDQIILLLEHRVETVLAIHRLNNSIRCPHETSSARRQSSRGSRPPLPISARTESAASGTRSSKQEWRASRAN